MSTRTTSRNQLWLAAVVLPIVTILLFGFTGGMVQLNSWISGIALGCAEAAIFIFIGFLIHRRKAASAAVPFFIASGAIIGIYAVSVLLEVILLGYLFKLPVSSYMMIHLITLLVFFVVLGLVALVGKYAGTHEQRETDHLTGKREIVDWIGSIRRKLSQMPVENIQALDRQVAELEETLRYSDPITHSSLVEVEHLIQQKIAMLEDQVALIGGSQKEQHHELTEQAVHIIRDILRTVQDRNTALLKAKAGST
ncbi:hypothetical protein PVOR_09849 [Paenibacillus vortex V453]|uniref:Uncharacterized protein n=2 Tax=Paenibacillus TaxID=44249 RepID=A0A163KSF5_9BACL|nr:MULTISPECIES: hypothetical protein [Paenibacillus]ANA81432.1 hypothetical protein A3958_16255 [Paenibacillus glucanolyticus]AVV59837.1 hypothetical protein C7121_28795 [Paenibacillus glucanolyticus]AWP29092.1 hypothetical protein B9D94_21845 [Paenibacillus sp. Cedars]EFU42159.1 hypothetical protein PVOR_09849 [Paenibacillus vortex V453]ETT35672.1 hypothetical protein C169_16729 [Paenibacillus sp. FSL R5-808]